MLKNSKTFNLSVEFYHLCCELKLPKHLKDQLVRASSSISLNLAEGYGKSTYKDQRRFFHIAFGSLRESQAILILAQLESTCTFNRADRLGACLYKLIHTNKIQEPRR